MYEPKSKPLADRSVYYKRLAKNGIIAFVIMIICLMIGVIGYHYTGNIPWLDALHNSAMILAGMGHVATITTVAGKWFSTFYALFSGVVFITNIGFFLAPVVHRFFHRFHLQDK